METPGPATPCPGIWNSATQPDGLLHRDVDALRSLQANAKTWASASPPRNLPSSLWMVSSHVVGLGPHSDPFVPPKPRMTTRPTVCARDASRVASWAPPPHVTVPLSVAIPYGVKDPVESTVISTDGAGGATDRFITSSPPDDSEKLPTIR